MRSPALDLPRISGIPAQASSTSSARDASVGSAIRLAAEIVIRLSSVIATLWLTRSLGVAPFGAFLLALSIGLMIAELCDLGINAIVVPVVVRSSRNLRTLLLVKAAMTAGVVALCVILIPIVSSLSGVPRDLIALCTIHFLGVGWIDLIGASLRSLGRRIEEALLLFVFRFVLVSLVIGAPFGLDLPGVSLSYALAVAPALLFGAGLLRAGALPPGPDASNVRVILRQAAPMGVNGFLTILSTRVELFLLQAFGGAAMVGLFGGALRIVESLLTLPSAIAAGALPAVARDVVNRSRGAAQRMFGQVVWVAVPAGVGLSLCAPGVLAVLGPGFVPGAPALRILSLALFLCFANAALFHVLIAASETRRVPRLTALRVATAAILGGILIPIFGLVGAALSFTGAEALLFGLLVRAARAHVHIQVARPVGRALLACLPMIALLSLFRPSLPVSIAAGGLLFAVAAGLILRQGSEEGGLA